MEVIKATSIFDFKRLTLANPEPLQSGSYFTKLSLDASKTFYIQMPKCVTKQGIIDIKGIKYCDLMYERSKCDDLIKWLEHLEYACQDKLDERKELWFQSELTRDDIEFMMSPITRVYQSGKYILIRVALNSLKAGGLEKTIAYNEKEINIDLDKLDATDSIVPLIVINGIKFSAKSFEIDIKLLQMMILDKPMENSCLIKLNSTVEMSVGANKIDTNKVDTNKIDTNKVDTNKVGSNIREKPLLIPLANNDKVKNNFSLEIPKPLLLVNTNKPIQTSNTPDNIKPIQTSNTPDNLKSVDKAESLEEVSFDYDSISDSINLKNPNEVYYEIYKVAREKAKQLRKVAMEAFLEAKEIKSKYMLSDFDDSSSDDLENSDVENSDLEES
jgi:hypothetical protein